MNGTKARRIAAVERYIHDLAIALADIPADEREDVIAGVREHIEDSLAGIDDPDQEDVERVLSSLGDPAEIAADARGRSGTAEPVPQSRAPGTAAPPQTPPTASGSPVAAAAVSGDRRPLLARDWTPIGVMGLFVLAALVTWFAGAFTLGVLFWLAGLVSLIASPLWSVAEKVIGAIWFGGLPLASGAVGLVVGGRVGLPGPRPYEIERFGRSMDPLRDSVAFTEWGWLAAAGFAFVGLLGTAVIMAWLVIAGSRRVQR